MKKGLILLTLLAVMAPIAAFPYALTTRINTSGGSLQVNAFPAQNNLSWVTRIIPNGTAANVVITPAANYTIAKIQQGVTYLPVTPGGQTVTIANTNTTAKTINVWFAKQKVSVTATAGVGGSVAPAGTRSYQAGQTVTYKFTPAVGNNVVSISGVPAGATVTPAVPAATDIPVTVSFPAQAASLNGVFQSIIANAGAPQTVMVGRTVTLKGSASGATTYAWTQTAGPVMVTLSDPTIAQPTFLGAVAGSYTFSLTVTDGGSKSATATTSVQITDSNASAARTQCENCHSSVGVGSGIYANWSTSIHSRSTHGICSACHVGSNTGGHPGDISKRSVNPTTFEATADLTNEGLVKGQVFCAYCHFKSVPNTTWPTDKTGIATCSSCHAAPSTGDAHTIYGAPTSNDCIGCHSTGIWHPGNAVNDNNGVRAITSEFQKWSHHVTGATLQNAHCAACHLEGKAEGGAIVIDTTYHMADNKTHLRNADDDSDMAWDPAAPNFTTMDNFCLSCHDANGATSTGSTAVQAVIVPASGKTASASNPFGDTISNQYDKLERPAVVDAAGQFATGNNSHHAVLGKRYSGRTRAAGDSRAVDESVVAFNSNSSAALPGARNTIFDAGKFQNDYTTLGNAAGESGARNGGTTLGDDSTLHCGDCHTVGQYSTLAPGYGGRYNKAVIGAHGSNNEYLLRNNIGTDARHQGAETTGNTSGVPTVGYGTKPYLVCFNCHAFATYGSVGGATGIAGLNHAGEYANSTRCNGPYNTVFGNMTGEARLRSMVTRTDDASYGQPSVSKGAFVTFGNVFGIQCANCHNSGVSAGNIFGGIHGSKDQTYTDGMGNTTKHFRFMPGLGNIMYVPGTKGGVTGGTLAAYNSYSGNYDGTAGDLGRTTVGQTFTTLPVRTIVTGSVNTTYGASAVYPKTGSYQYTTGGASNDLNWEQKTQQPVSGEFDFQAKSMGCYTLSPPGTVKVVGRNGDADKLAATDSIEAPYNGPVGTKEVFDNWGGCDDHNGAQGAGTGIVRKVLRKVSY